MKNADITDPLFKAAIEAIEAGDTALLNKLITENPQLVQDRVDLPEPGYFQNPYLLWFVADNPIRVGRLPQNIADVAQVLIGFVKQFAPVTVQQQLDYTLGLVATGRIPKECGVQITLMDALINAGAKPGGGLGALAHDNIEAAAHLINRGGKLTLAAAIGLDRMDDVIHFKKDTDKAGLLLALAVAAFYGKSQTITYLLNLGVDPNGYPENDDGFHSHATPLHQAVFSGSLECVRLLLEAGARLDMPDKIYKGTPLGWAMHMENDAETDAGSKERFKEIVRYLKYEI